MGDRLNLELNIVGRRFRSYRLWLVLGILWLIAAIIGFAIYRSYPASFDFNPLYVCIAFATIVAIVSLATIIVIRRTARDPKWLASRIEAAYPELDSKLLTAVHETERQNGQLNFLQQKVVHQAISHNHLNPWTKTISTSKLFFARATGVLAFLLVVGVSLGILMSPKRTDARLVSPENLNLAMDSDLVFNSGSQLTVEPGDAEVERGQPLVIVARFAGMVPSTCQLTRQLSADEADTTEEMTRSLDDPLYAKRISRVKDDFSYQIKAGSTESETYKISVYDLPRLKQMDVEVDYPAFTKREKKRIIDTKRVTAVKGSIVTPFCQLNMPVESAKLIGRDGSIIDLESSNPESNEYSVAIPLTASIVYELHLVDSNGRENRTKPQLVLNATKNRTPQIEIVTPKRDVQVSPLEELFTQAKISDDFGVKEYGVAYSVGEDSPNEIVLGSDAAPKEIKIAEHMIYLEELAAKEGDVLTYFYWAEDSLSDNTTRRIFSDMFFAEVRPFEEIFRQGDQNQQQQQQQQNQQQNQQQQQQAAQLAELQKQIINATWRQIRTANAGDADKSQFVADLDVISESQSSAIGQLEQFAQKVPNLSEQAISKLRSTMQKVLLALHETPASNPELQRKPLNDALRYERSAYQQIVKLQPKEANISQQQSQQQQQQSQQSRQQQQLQQLQLDNKRNKYEQEKQAQQPQQDQAAQENREILNRLRELARRQEDLNKQLQELQTALEQAKTEEEREEIERRLKRLREQQEEILQDIDKLQEKTDTSENQQELADVSQELENARENVQRSKEELDKQNLTQAAAAGTKAQEKFEELRDEMRKRNAGKFVEQMKDLKKQANDLQEQQQKINEELDKAANSKDLRNTLDRESVEKQSRLQEKRLEDLFNEMRTVIEQSEESEPLLSNELYDTFRKAKRDQIAEKMKESRQLLDRGFVDETRAANEQVNEDMKGLKQGIDQAAQFVLGDETESLKLARDLVEQLKDELDSEMKELDPNSRERASSERQSENRKARNSERDSENSKGKKGKQGQRGSKDAKSKSQGEGDSDQKSNRKSDQEPKSKNAKNAGKSGKQGPSKQDSKNNSNNDSDSKSSSKSNPNRSQKSGKSSSKNSKGKSSGSDSISEASDQKNDSKSPSKSKSPSNSKQSGGGANPNQRPNDQRSQQGQFNDLTEQFNQMNQAQKFSGGRPLTGDNYRDWVDRLRNVEDLLEDQDLRSEAARIREEMREFRKESKRHASDPKWDLVREQVAKPLEMLQKQLTREILKRQSKEALVPIDRQPVVPGFENSVRRYYERIGSGNTQQQ